MQSNNANTILLPKLKKISLRQKIMLDPADFRTGVPSHSLPLLHEQGLIICLTPNQPTPPSKLTHDGTLKLTLTHSAQLLQLLNRYVEVKLIDDYQDVWIGELFGITVKGRGRSDSTTNIRACKVLAFEGETLVVESLPCPAGNPAWKNLLEKVQHILSNSNPNPNSNSNPPPNK